MKLITNYPLEKRCNTMSSREKTKLLGDMYAMPTSVLASSTPESELEIYNL
jgi:hypothetical protein